MGMAVRPWEALKRLATLREQRPARNRRCSFHHDWWADYYDQLCFEHYGIKRRKMSEMLHPVIWFVGCFLPYSHDYTEIGLRPEGTTQRIPFQRNN